MDITIRRLDDAILPGLIETYRKSTGNPREQYFKDLLTAQEKGTRVVLVALHKNDVTGHVTIKWQSEYPSFAEKGIPEINDLWVLREYRRQGVAAALVDEAERIIFQRSRLAGIGVGMYADYGPAQQMYVRRGYVPDGNGLYHGKQPVMPGYDVFVDDDLVLYSVKERPAET